MVKYIIHLSDIHIRNNIRHDEYAVQLQKLINSCKELTKDIDKNEIRIVISGDIVHQKNTISPDLMPFVSSFIRDLEKVAKVIIIAGNHDLIVTNLSKKDTITSIFETAKFENTLFIDYLTNFKSGYIIDDNIAWCLYSIYDNYRKPEFSQIKKENNNLHFIGLYHGMINGATFNNGEVIDNSLDGDIFDGCEIVMAGDIHKRQVLRRGESIIVYPGSLIQQSFGETVTQHGFVFWNLEDLSYNFIDLESDYSLYDFEINNYDDIDNDKEILRNY